MEARAEQPQNRQMGVAMGRGRGGTVNRWLYYATVCLVGIALIQTIALYAIKSSTPPTVPHLPRIHNPCNKFGCIEYPTNQPVAQPLTSQQPINLPSNPDNSVKLILAGLVASVIAFVASGAGWYKVNAHKRKTEALAGLTQEDIDVLNKEQLEREQDREYFKLVRKEVNQLRKDVPMFLSNMMKLDYDVSTYGKTRARPKKRKKDLIKFEWIGLTKTEVWFKIDTYKLPYGVSVLKLKDPGVTENLKHGINRPCLWHTDNSFNVFLRVGLRSGHLGVPTFVNWLPDTEKDKPGVDHKMPAVTSNKYLVPVGVDATNRLRYVDLVEWPHGLVLGATGRGKTSILLLWLAVLMKRHTPREAQFILIDLKKAAFPRFKRLPHVQEMTIDTYRAIELLEGAVQVIEDRNTAYSEQAYNIDDWNRRYPHLYQHRLFVFVDELSLIMQSTDKDVSSRAVTAILRIVQLGRSCGVHLILGTQTVNKHVLRHEITGNIEGRVCYHVKTKSSSILAIGSDDASELYLPGRAIFDQRGNNIVVQSPFATDHEIDQMLYEIAGRDYTQINEDRFWEIALEEPLSVSGNGMYERLNKAWGKRRCSLFLQNWEFNQGNNYPVLSIYGEDYVLLSNGRGLDRALIPMVDGLLAVLKEDDSPVVPVVELADQGAIEGEYTISESPKLSKSPKSSEYKTEPNLSEFILSNLNGIARVEDITNSELGLSEYLTKKLLKELEYKPAEENVIEIDNKRFILTKTIRPIAPRFLLPVNGHLPQSNHELKLMAKDYWNKHYASDRNQPETETA